MSTIYEEMQMLDEQLETELLEDDVGLDNWEFEDSEDDELEEETLDKTDDSEESELTPEEEEIIVELLRMLNDSLDKVLSNAIQKLLELNKTQEIQMRSEVVELESGETYLLQLAFLPSETNPEKGWWIPVDVDLIFGKPKRKDAIERCLSSGSILRRIKTQQPGGESKSTLTIVCNVR